MAMVNDSTNSMGSSAMFDVISSTLQVISKVMFALPLCVCSNVEISLQIFV